MIAEWSLKIHKGNFGDDDCHSDSVGSVLSFVCWLVILNGSMHFVQGEYNFRNPSLSNVKWFTHLVQDENNLRNLFLC